MRYAPDHIPCVASLVSVLLLVIGLAPSQICSAAEPPTADAGYRWFSVPITVVDLPEKIASLPLSARIDFGQFLQQLDATGIVDERSLQLLRRNADGTETEIPVQLLPDEQPRSKTREFQAGTVEGVSYVTEFPPAKQAAAPSLIGTVTWIADTVVAGRADYRLRFAQPTRGRAIQVPYGPNNLRVFDGQQRATPVRHFPVMQIRPQWPLLGQLNVLDNRRLVTTYFVGPSREEAAAATTSIRRPFLYPVHDPDGYALTELGKAHDPTGSHRHHYSLWISHADVSGHSFWSDREGIIAHEAWELLEDGPVFCRIAVRNVWLDAGKPILRERRTMTFYRSSEKLQIIDFDLQYEPADAGEVKLGSTTFGFLSVRTAQSMTPFDGSGEIINARGQRNEQAAHLQRAEWMDLSGPVDRDRWSGIALLDHPGNLSHPTAWHCRNDGWACASVNHEHPHTIGTGESLSLRYRVLLHRGNAEQADVANHFRGFASAPTIRIGEAVPQ